MLTGSDAVEFGRARHHRRLGGAVGVPHLAARRPGASRSASSGGQASPPKISSRTASSASAGHSAASVGTVDTTVMSRDTSHGPRSMPLRTSERGAGTRQAPLRQASHISSHDASNATDSPASTRSPGPIGLSCRNICASASTNAAALRWVTATPFGVPVEPDVKMIHASSRPSGDAGAPTAGGADAADQALLGDDTDHTRLAEHQRGPLVGVVGVDRHVGGAGGQGRQDRDVQRVAARRHADADAVAATDAARGQPRDALLDVGDQLGVGQLHVAVVDGGRIGMAHGGLVQDVDQRARLGARTTTTGTAQELPASPRLQRTKRLPARVCIRLGFSLSATVVAPRTGT